jgi:hypothetical protein
VQPRFYGWGRPGGPGTGHSCIQTVKGVITYMRCQIIPRLTIPYTDHPPPQEPTVCCMYIPVASLLSQAHATYASSAGSLLTSTSGTG